MIDSILGGSIIGAGASLINGFFQRSAAKKAAEIQANAAKAAGQHLEDTISSVNPGIIGAAGRAGDRMMDTSWNAITGVNDATRDANAKLNPYAESGVDANNLIRMGMTPGGDFNKTPTLSDLQIDPGYDFRLTEGQKALERSAAARGGATGGGALKAITDFGQRMGSQEYQNAFERFRQSIGDRFGRLNTVAGRGFDAAGTQGSNLIGASKIGAGLATEGARYAGDVDINAVNRTSSNTIGGAEEAGKYITGAGEAQAAGIVGGTNAITGAIGSGISGIQGAITLQQLLKNPADYTGPYNKIKAGASSGGYRQGPVGADGKAWGGG